MAERKVEYLSSHYASGGCKKLIGEHHHCIWGFPKIRDTLVGYSILGSILGSPYFGKLPYHCGEQKKNLQQATTAPLFLTGGL